MDTCRRLDRLPTAAVTRRIARAGYPTHEMVTELVTDVAMRESVAMRDPRPLWRAAKDSNPGHQIRSQPSPVPHGPSHPFASPLVLVNSRSAGPSRACVPACHAWHGRNVVAVSSHERQTLCLVTRRLLVSPGWKEYQISDLVLYYPAPNLRSRVGRHG
jgi:hypothetical protein